MIYVNVSRKFVEAKQFVLVSRGYILSSTSKLFFFNVVVRLTSKLIKG